MTFTYIQDSGKFLLDSILIGFCYSGNDVATNNPSCQAIQNHGPIPCGNYTIGPPLTGTHLGPTVFALTPDKDNVMFNRSGFYIHWDNARRDFSASDGCIVMLQPTQMLQVLGQGNHQLVVKAYYQ